MSAGSDLLGMLHSVPEEEGGAIFLHPVPQCSPKSEFSDLSWAEQSKRVAEFFVEFNAHPYKQASAIRRMAEMVGA